MEYASQAQLDPPPVPELSVSLWTYRHDMESRPDQVLGIINDIGISKVEVAGFLDKSATSLQKALAEHNLTVRGIHAPALTPARQVDFYVKWAREYAHRFATTNVVLESSPLWFSGKSEAGGHAAYDQITALLRQIASELENSNLSLSYHCFPHDFSPKDGVPRVLQLFPELAHRNLGLQLDTYWLHQARANISELNGIPIHSVHINERDSIGNCTIVGTDPSRCLCYLAALRSRLLSGAYILELDPTDEVRSETNVDEYETLANNVKQWSSTWKSIHTYNINQPPLQGARDFATTPFNATHGSHALPIVKTNDVGRLFNTEIREARTEFLFGSDRWLRPLALNCDTSQFYTTSRFSKSLGGAPPATGGRNPTAPSFENEEKFFLAYWPPNESSKLVQLVGGAGSGKSTFLRFFFQYYLPNRDALLSGTSRNSLLASRYKHDLAEHIILYADLRHPAYSVAESIKSFLFHELLESLKETLSGLGHSGLLRDMTPAGDNNQANLALMLAKIKATNAGGRPLFVSWILDNADQLSEEEHRELMNVVQQFLPPDDGGGVVSGNSKGTDLWRIIVPVRPETLDNLERTWHPLKTEPFVFRLGSLDFDDVLRRRARLLSRRLIDKGKHLNLDIWAGDDRPYFDMSTPDEVGNELEQMLLSAGRIDPKYREKAISSSARETIDDLCGDSARRRMVVLCRAAFSKSFAERFRRAIDERWQFAPFVTDFFFYNGLLCGDNLMFDQHVEKLPILNFYRLGASLNSANSTFVGLRALFLLQVEEPCTFSWAEIRDYLSRMGFEKNDVDFCEGWLIKKEIIKELWNGGHMVERSIARACWRMLKETAFTDVMAVSCAQEWGTKEMAQPTDPLDNSELLIRFSGSVWFMQQIWMHEQAVGVYRRSMDAQCGRYDQFAELHRKLKIPSITHYICGEYLKRIGKWPIYEGPASALREDGNIWRARADELRGLFDKATSPFQRTRQ